MKRILTIVFIFLLPASLLADEKVKEKKVAKYIMENIQKDYLDCYSFYKVAAESFKKAGKDQGIIKNLENSADVSLKYNYDLGEIMGLNPEVMAEMTKTKIDTFVKMANKDFSSLAKKYFQYEVIWITIFIMGMLGLLFDITIRKIIDKTIPWRGKG